MLARAVVPDHDHDHRFHPYSFYPGTNGHGLLRDRRRVRPWGTWAGSLPRHGDGTVRVRHAPDGPPTAELRGRPLVRPSSD
jgi:hypothetical protein